MDHVVICPRCRQKMRATKDLLGKSVQCPKCGDPFTAAADEPPGSPAASVVPSLRRKDAGAVDWGDVADDAPPPRARSRRADPPPPAEDRRRKRGSEFPLWAWILLIIFGVKLVLALIIFCVACLVAALGRNAEERARNEGRGPDGERREAEPRPILPRDVGALAPLNLEGPDVSRDWMVLFRSHDPSIWGKDVNQGPSHMARPLSRVSNDIAYLRLRKGADYVIVPIEKSRLSRAGSGRSGWHGANNLDYKGCHLGIFDKAFLGQNEKDIALFHGDAGPWFSGWGFGHIAYVDRQGYCWDGVPIAPQVLEIAVKGGRLTEAETDKLVGGVRPLRPLRLEGADVSRGWQVIFRSSDPRLWDRDANRGDGDFAMALADVPEGIRYLRVRKDRQYVIIPMSKDRLRQLVENKGNGWEGRNVEGWGARHLGVFSNSLPTNRPGQVNVRVHPNFRGWGFGNKNHVDDEQGYVWEGKTIPPTVLEIAVSKDELTPAERKKLLWREAL